MIRNRCLAALALFTHSHNPRQAQSALRARFSTRNDLFFLRPLEKIAWTCKVSRPAFDLIASEVKSSAY
ncbi:hypothetical protein ABH975_002717 [Bradyrhizobium ottawaense]